MVTFTAPPDREARLESRALPPSATRFALASAPAAPQARPAAGIEGVLNRLQTSLDRVEARQTATLNAIEESYDTRAKRIRGVLVDRDDASEAAGLQAGNEILADEAGGGKIRMLEAGGFAGTDVAALIHPGPVDVDLGPEAPREIGNGIKIPILMQHPVLEP